MFVILLIYFKNPILFRLQFPLFSGFLFASYLDIFGIHQVYTFSIHLFCKWSEMISDHFFSESNFLAKFHGAIDSRTSFGM